MTDTRPAVRFIDYMSSDSLDFTNIIGPYENASARNRDLARIENLALGAPEYNGGQQFASATMADAVGEIGWSLRVVEPAQVTEVTTQRSFHAAFFGYEEETDEDAQVDPHEPHADQIALFR